MSEDLEQFIVKQRYQLMKMNQKLLKQLLKVLRGARNGFYYGARLRFVHALVMTLLFKTINRKNLVGIVSISVDHGLFLAKFVFLFKTALKLLNWGSGRNKINILISGAAVGFLLNQQKTTVKQQLVLYLFSRVISATAFIFFKKILAREFTPKSQQLTFVALAALCWGSVMILFELKRGVLQASLQSSMEYLYEQQVRWEWLQRIEEGVNRLRLLVEQRLF